MFGNDRIGDCTCVAAHQMVQTWSANTDTKDYRPVARDVILTYSRLTGYNRRTGEHDDGANMLDVLKWWRRHGLSTGHMIDAFAAVDTDDVKESLPQAIYRFGGVYLGFALPEYVESKPRWHMADSPGGQAARAYGFGGHAVFGCAYDADGITVISWGAERMSIGRFCIGILTRPMPVSMTFGSTATVAHRADWTPPRCAATCWP